MFYPPFPELQLAWHAFAPRRARLSALLHLVDKVTLLNGLYSNVNTVWVCHLARDSSQRFFYSFLPVFDDWH